MDERLRLVARLLEGLVMRHRHRRHKASGTPLVAAHAAHGLWCADDKGEFLLGNRQYCYPLTITDYRSRFLLAGTIPLGPTLHRRGSGLSARGSTCLRCRLLQYLGHSRLPTRASRLPIGNHFRWQSQR